MKGISSANIRSLLLKYKDKQKENLLKKEEMVQKEWADIQILEKHNDTIEV